MKKGSGYYSGHWSEAAIKLRKLWRAPLRLVDFLPEWKLTYIVLNLLWPSTDTRGQEANITSKFN